MLLEKLPDAATRKLAAHPRPVTRGRLRLLAVGGASLLSWLDAALVRLEARRPGGVLSVLAVLSFVITAVAVTLTHRAVSR